MQIYTIGVAQTPAETFFRKIRRAGVTRVFDVRLRAAGQLSGFAKSTDLAYFLRELTAIAYQPLPDFAPTSEMLAAYRNRVTTWDQYAAAYRTLLQLRRPDRDLAPELLDGACFLCTEAFPDRCHRRVAVEYLRDIHAGRHTLEIRHL